MGLNGQELRTMGDQLQGTGTSSATALWNAANRIERAEHPSADARMLVGLAARRAVRLMQAVLLSELTRSPAQFTSFVAAFANGVVREAGENLNAFPFDERLKAFNGLAAELAAGLGLGLAEKVEAPPSTHLPTERLKQAFGGSKALRHGTQEDETVLSFVFPNPKAAAAAHAALAALLDDQA